LAANPDALYVMAQTVLVQNIALDQAKAQVAQLQQQVQQARQQPAHATSFLGNLLGIMTRRLLSRRICAAADLCCRLLRRLRIRPAIPAQPQYQQPAGIHSGRPAEFSTRSHADRGGRSGGRAGV
jgi:hypothetical protein